MEQNQMIASSAVKVLEKCDINDRLNFPSKFLRDNENELRVYAESGLALRVNDFNTGKVYEFILTARPKGGRNLSKPVFNRGEWRKFVGDRGLKVGNKILFWKHAENGQFYIQVVDPLPDYTKLLN